MERIIEVGVPKGALRGLVNETSGQWNSLGKKLSDPVKEDLQKHLTAAGHVGSEDVLMYTFFEDPNVDSESLKRSIKIINIHGEGVEPSEFNVSVEIMGIDRSN